MIEAVAKFFVQGGAFMWVILLVLGAAAAVVLERLLFYYRSCLADSAALAAGVAGAIERNDLDGAEALAQGKSPLHGLLRALVKRYRAGLSYKEIRQGVDEAAVRELPRFTERLNYLSLFANTATLLGLLGTIFGLITSFSSLSVAEASQKAALLAQGISVAMNTTAFGLIVAVPCMAAHTVLSNKQAALVNELDESLLRLLNFVEGKRP